jgi:hypothetical protein
MTSTNHITLYDACAARKNLLKTKKFAEATALLILK